MDQGDGKFAPLEPALADVLTARLREAASLPARIEDLWPRLFIVGAEVEIRKSRFRVEYIGTDVLVLKLLPSTRADALTHPPDGT